MGQVGVRDGLAQSHSIRRVQRSRGVVRRGRGGRRWRLRNSAAFVFSARRHGDREHLPERAPASMRGDGVSEPYDDLAFHFGSAGPGGFRLDRFRTVRRGNVHFRRRLRRTELRSGIARWRLLHHGHRESAFRGRVVRMLRVVQRGGRGNRIPRRLRLTAVSIPSFLAVPACARSGWSGRIDVVTRIDEPNADGTSVR